MKARGLSRGLGGGETLGREALTVKGGGVGVSRGLGWCRDSLRGSWSRSICVVILSADGVHAVRHTRSLHVRLVEQVVWTTVWHYS